MGILGSIGLLCVALFGCTNANFKADRKSKAPAGQQSNTNNNPNQPGGNPNDPNGNGAIPGANGSDPSGQGSGTPGEGISIDDGASKVEPQACTALNGSVIANDGQCPEHQASYTADEGGRKIGCCPLPAKDILVAGSVQQRTGSCEADEMVTGLSAGAGLYCTKINTGRYLLAPSQTACYFGSGSSGRGSAERCPKPVHPSLLPIVEKVMGSDGAIAVPYGALVTSYRGNDPDASDIAGSVLQFKDTNQPVPMLP